MKRKQSNNRLKILYLPRWYPHKFDPMPGLFIERHGRSVLPHADVSVLYVHPDENQKGKTYLVNTSDESDDLFTIRIYYKKNTSKLPLVASLVNGWRFIRANAKGLKMIKYSRGRMDLIHVHVLTRLGVIALVQKWLHGTPFLITEHWTRYLPTTDTYHGFFRKKITNLVARNAAAILPVTANLRDAMIDCGLKNDNYVVIPNVVDVDMFSPKQRKKSDKKNIIHLSCFLDDQKNISGILRILKRLSEQRDDFICTMVGDGADFDILKGYSDQLGLTDKYTFFLGLKENKELAGIMADADFMVMFSNYENLPVVILESYSVGVPVLSTRVGGIHEHLHKELGFLIEKEDEEALFEKMNYMLDHIESYDREQIRQYALDHFSNEVIGRSLFKVYSESAKK